MLSNPGKVTTGGATVAPNLINNQPSVLDPFLQGGKGNASTGAGGYSNPGLLRHAEQAEAGMSGVT